MTCFVDSVPYLTISFIHLYIFIENLTGELKHFIIGLELESNLNLIQILQAQTNTAGTSNSPKTSSIRIFKLCHSIQVYHGI